MDYLASLNFMVVMIVLHPYFEQGWISEMASYLKSIDGNHLLEAGLEGFYGESNRDSNPNFQVGTDFIANNQIPTIDFATLHSYPDQWFAFLISIFFSNHYIG
jgi:endo-1,4-beta-mannosidase